MQLNGPIKAHGGHTGRDAGLVQKEEREETVLGRGFRKMRWNS